MDKKDTVKWGQIMEKTKELSTIEVPRYIGGKNSQLICFCDASKDAYATAIYLKTIDEERKSRVNLIFSRARIAPKKPLSIPRLELMALLIGVRSLRFISKELGLESTERIIWTDFQCILNWLKGKKPLSVFVKNRITEITNKKNVEFRYINTKNNHADLTSKGINSKELKQSPLWWNGKEWLKDDLPSWPTWNLEKINQETIDKIQSEVKGPTTLYEATILFLDLQVSQQTEKMTPFGLNENKHSSSSKLLRITAYANRFFQKLKKVPTTKRVPTSDKIKVARNQCIKKALQKKHIFHTENGKTKLSKTTAKNWLNPKLGEDGIIRCYGRMTNTNLPQETIIPILLPWKEKFVELMIEEYDKRLLHAGVNHTLSQMRTKYWIVCGKFEVKKVLRKCRICRK